MKMYPYTDAAYDAVIIMASISMVASIFLVVFVLICLWISADYFVNYRKETDLDKKSEHYTFRRYTQRTAVVALVLLVISSVATAILMNTRLMTVYDRFTGSIASFVSDQVPVAVSLFVAGVAVATLIAVLLDKPFTSYDESEDEQRDLLGLRVIELEEENEELDERVSELEEENEELDELNDEYLQERITAQAGEQEAVAENIELLAAMNELEQAVESHNP
ncbi:MAG: hypothetical protein WAR37_04515 [Candidatus Microsaccharimonas sp.]